MASVLRGLVSKNKIRFKDDQEGFDLDLTCILSCGNTAGSQKPTQNREIGRFTASFPSLFLLF